MNAATPKLRSSNKSTIRQGFPDRNFGKAEHFKATTATAKMVDFNGTYSFVRNENFEEYLNKLGVPALPRKMMLTNSPSVTISQSGENWRIEMKAVVKTHIIQFKLGEEFEDSMPDGATFKSKGEMEGDSLKITSKETGRGDMERTYSLVEDELVLCLKNTTHNVEAKRFFKKN